MHYTKEHQTAPLSCRTQHTSKNTVGENTIVITFLKEFRKKEASMLASFYCIATLKERWPGMPGLVLRINLLQFLAHIPSPVANCYFQRYLIIVGVCIQKTIFQLLPNIPHK